jgi:hypothetical protein
MLARTLAAVLITAAAVTLSTVGAANAVPMPYVAH